MKHCPACNFSFPDFHLVCDFDGTELVTTPEKSLVGTRRPSRLRRLGRSPFFLVLVTVLALVSSAILFGYYDSLTQGPQRAQSLPADSANSVIAGANGSEQPGDVYQTVGSPSSKAAKLAKNSPARRIRRTQNSQPSRSSIAARKRATPNLQTAWRNNPERLASAKKSDSQRHQDADRSSAEKDTKVVAMLKTTWRVLKRPFKL